MDGMSVSELVNLMGSVNLNDPAQADAAVQVLSAAAAGPITTRPVFRNIVETTQPPTLPSSADPGRYVYCILLWGQILYNIEGLSPHRARHIKDLSPYNVCCFLGGVSL